MPEVGIGHSGGMTPEDFVNVLRSAVVETTTHGQLSQLRQPSGNAPWPNTVRRSEWFNALTGDNQEMVAELVHSVAFAATFGVCCILDGVQALDPEGGSLRLLHLSADGTETWLNDPSRCELHIELRGDGPPP
jgi:hypothetical protein